jgi:hypothetical protein
MTTTLQSHIDRLSRDWQSIAGEQVEVHRNAGAFYAFGSELACLRLLAKYRDCKDARYGFSKSFNSFYFSLETPDISYDNNGEIEKG